MQASQLPSKIPLPFANSGTKNTIPTASQIGITAGAASLTDGFPPLTMTPLSAGGVPPSGADFNGILNLITAIQQWQSAGGSFKFDAAFATAVGGYPKGATLIKASSDGFWISTVDNNTANPDTGGAGWSDLVRTPNVGGTASAFTPSIGSRSKGTIYTNSTGRPLVVSIVVQTGTTTGNGAVLKVGGLEVAQFYNQGTAGYYGYLFSIVPPGATYQVVDSVGTNTITIWQEL